MERGREFPFRWVWTGHRTEHAPYVAPRTAKAMIAGSAYRHGMEAPGLNRRKMEAPAAAVGTPQ